MRRQSEAETIGKNHECREMRHWSLRTRTPPPEDSASGKRYFHAVFAPWVRREQSRFVFLFASERMNIDKKMETVTTSADLRQLLGLAVGDADRVESEMSGLPHLLTDLRLERTDSCVETRDARQAKTAAEAMRRIPEANEAFHLAISGRFALWHFVPAAIQLAGCSIKRLHLATLGFSKKNIASLAEFLDAGQIGHVRLLCSHYFRGTSKNEYAFAVEAFAMRPDRAEFLSVRTHAKLALLAFEDGRTMTIESSANLRSCKNCENATLIGNPAVYTFHRTWLDDLFSRAENRT